MSKAARHVHMNILFKHSC